MLANEEHSSPNNYFPRKVQQHGNYDGELDPANTVGAANEKKWEAQVLSLFVLQFMTALLLATACIRRRNPRRRHNVIVLSVAVQEATNQGNERVSPSVAAILVRSREATSQTLNVGSMHVTVYCRIGSLFPVGLPDVTVVMEAPNQEDEEILPQATAVLLTDDEIVQTSNLTVFCLTERREPLPEATVFLCYAE